MKAENSESHLQLGNLLANQGKHEKAIMEFHKCLKLDPNNAYAWNNIGVAKLCLGLASAALEYFDRAIEIDPGYRDGFHNRGLAYSDLNELDLALQNLDTAINIDPSI